MPHRSGNPAGGRRGSALLTVLWLSAALSAIAFAMSLTVRSEIDRAATSVDDLRSYYLATAAVDRAAMELLWSATGAAPLIPRDAATVDYQFPSGSAHVEILPEAGKLDINKASHDDLMKVMMNLGIDPPRADMVAAGIVDWRGPGGGGGSDSHYLSRTPSFQSPHASFQEIEELMAVNGVTPDIFYGTWTAAANGQPGAGLVRRPGLIDCFTVYGSPMGMVDQRSAGPAVLSAIGAPSGAVQNAYAQRATGMGTSDATELVMQGHAAITFRATAHLRLSNGKFSDMQRTVSALVMYLVGTQSETPYHVLRWYDTAWSN